MCKNEGVQVGIIDKSKKKEKLKTLFHEKMTKKSNQVVEMGKNGPIFHKRNEAIQTDESSLENEADARFDKKKTQSLSGLEKSNKKRQKVAQIQDSDKQIQTKSEHEGLLKSNFRLSRFDQRKKKDIQSEKLSIKREKSEERISKRQKEVSGEEIQAKSSLGVEKFHQKREKFTDDSSSTDEEINIGTIPKNYRKKLRKVQKENQNQEIQVNFDSELFQPQRGRSCWIQDAHGIWFL